MGYTQKEIEKLQRFYDRELGNRKFRDMCILFLVLNLLVFAIMDCIIRGPMETIIEQQTETVQKQTRVIAQQNEIIGGYRMAEIALEKTGELRREIFDTRMLLPSNSSDYINCVD